MDLKNIDPIIQKLAGAATALVAVAGVFQFLPHGAAVPLSSLIAALAAFWTPNTSAPSQTNQSAPNLPLNIEIGGKPNTPAPIDVASPEQSSVPRIQLTWKDLTGVPAPSSSALENRAPATPDPNNPMKQLKLTLSVAGTQVPGAEAVIDLPEAWAPYINFAEGVYAKFTPEKPVIEATAEILDAPAAPVTA